MKGFSGDGGKRRQSRKGKENSEGKPLKKKVQQHTIVYKSPYPPRSRRGEKSLPGPLLEEGSHGANVRYKRRKEARLSSSKKRKPIC